MEISNEEIARLEKFYYSTVARINKLSMEQKLHFMQSEALRELSLEIGEYLKTAPMNDADFIYWMRIADEYFAQSSGQSSLGMIRSNESTALFESLVNECRKYGIEIDRENLTEADFFDQHTVIE